MSQSKYALVTGASSGIGKSFCYQLAQKKYNIILVSRKLDLLEPIAVELHQKFGVEVKVFAKDLSVEGDVDSLFAEISKANLSIDLLINNAGCGFFKPISDSDWKKQKGMIDLNIMGLSKMTFSMVSYWKNQNLKGNILNVSSMGAYTPLSNFAVYVATKSYVKTFSLSLREELKDQGINVCCLCPGGTTTNFVAEAGQSLTTAATKFMMSSDECAEIALKGLERNQAVIVPGIMNKLTVISTRFLPESTMTGIFSKVYNSMVKN